MQERDDSAKSGTKGKRMEKLGFYLFGCIEGFVLTFQMQTKIERSDILIRNHNKKQPNGVNPKSNRRWS